MRVVTGVLFVFVAVAAAGCGGPEARPAPVEKCWIISPEDRPRPPWVNTPAVPNSKGGGIAATGVATLTPELRDDKQVLFDMVRLAAVGDLAGTVRTRARKAMDDDVTKNIGRACSAGASVNQDLGAEAATGEASAECKRLRKLETAFNSATRLDSGAFLTGVQRADLWENGQCDLYGLYYIPKANLKDLLACGDGEECAEAAELLSDPR